MKPLEKRSQREIKKAIATLKEALEAGVGARSAATFADLSEEDYENLARMHPEIKKLAETAETNLGTQASINIKDAIVKERDVKTSQWYKEHTDPKFSKKMQVESSFVSAKEREKEVEALFEGLDE